MRVQQSPLESSPVPPLSKGLTPPEQVLLFLPGSIRELELLQPLRRSTSFTALWIRFKAKSCTHPGRGVGCLAAAGCGSIALEGGQPASHTFLSTALPSKRSCCSQGWAEAGSPAWISLPGRQIPFPVPSCCRAYLRLSFGGCSASPVFGVDLVVFHLAFGGDGEPRALIWMMDHINSDSFAPIPGT